jgi:SAM-dependent methyltransferase
VLEIGCGTGHALVSLAGEVGTSGQVHGVDVSSGMMAVARRRVESAGLPHAPVHTSKAIECIMHGKCLLRSPRPSPSARGTYRLIVVRRNFQSALAVMHARNDANQLPERAGLRQEGRAAEGASPAPIGSVGAN